MLFVALISAINSPEQRAHFFGLLGRSWNALLSASSSSTFGLLYYPLGGAVVGFALVVGWKHYGKSSLPWKQALAEAGLPAFVFALLTPAILALVAGSHFIVRTVFDDHQSYVRSAQQLNSRIPVLEANNLKLSKENDSLRSQPPQTITKLVEPQNLPLQIKTRQYMALDVSMALDASSPVQKGHVYQILGITNKKIAPVSVVLSCTADFRPVGPTVVIAAPNEFVSISNLIVKQTDARTLEFSADSPAWTPDTPLGFSLFTDATKGFDCTIKQKP